MENAPVITALLGKRASIESKKRRSGAVSPLPPIRRDADRPKYLAVQPEPASGQVQRTQLFDIRLAA
jgi:hypothetical protein